MFDCAFPIGENPQVALQRKKCGEFAGD